MVSVGVGDELGLAVDSELDVGSLDVVPDGMAGEIQLVSNTVDAFVLVIKFHDPQLSVRQFAVELGKTYHSFILALPSQRTLDLLEVEYSVVIVVVLGVEFSEVALQEPTDAQEVVIRAVEAALSIALVQGLECFRIECLYPLQDLFDEFLVLFRDLLGFAVSHEEQAVVTDVKFSLHFSLTFNFG